ncbi:MAG: leucine-rich repeat domain-containing protein, partial [Bacilli bacterium]|nr:leucine-rich repeat domain-containing protein [Bacilli bacterium]
SNAKNLKLSSDTFMNAKLGTLILSNPLDSNVGNVFSSSKINKLIVTTDFVNTNNQNYQFNSSEINTAIITGGEDTKLIEKNTGHSIFEGSIIKNLIISDGITEIGPAVFNEANIENLRFSGTLKTIGSGAFERNKLTSLTIPASVETIGSHAFEHNQLTTINFESNSKLKTIGALAFQYNNLTNVTIPASVETIDAGAFQNNQLTTINFESNSKLKTIGTQAFYNNKLTNTGLGKLPSSLTGLDTFAFRNNPDLTQIILTSPKDLTGWPNGGTVDGKTVTYER